MRQQLFTLFFLFISGGLFAQNKDFTYQKGRTLNDVPATLLTTVVNVEKIAKPQRIVADKIPQRTQTARVRITLPEYESGLFFSRDYRKDDHVYPNNTNRMLPWHFTNLVELLNPNYEQIPSVSAPAKQGEALLLKLKNGKYLFLKAVAGENSLSWLMPNADGSVSAFVSTLGQDFLPSEAPLLLAAQSSDMYQPFSQVAKLVNKPQALREQKPFFEAFQYLGWCTWEHYLTDINQEKILSDIQKINASSIPIRYVLIDDGHLQFTQNQLTSISPDTEKFPDAWRKIIQTKNPDKIKWMGLWLCFSGYWNGIAPQNQLPPDLNKNLYQQNHTLLPGKSLAETQRYYTAYLNDVKNQGFDFVKMDNQSFLLPLYMGGKRAVEQARNGNIALERAAHSLQLGLINCMAQNTLNIDNTHYSNLSRVSIDYKKLNLDMARSHVWQSYVNTLIQGQNVFPDHDMFHSSDSVAGALMARSKAISGGAVYLSDAPEDFVPENIMPIVDENGKIFRPQAPAIPFPDALDANSFTGKTAFRVFAPTGSDAMSIICYNLGEKSDEITYQISLADYAHRNAMLSGKKPVDARQFVLFDHESGQATLLDAETPDYRASLTGFSDKLFHLVPITQGWAVMGLEEKYISPETVKIISRTNKELKIKPLATGTLLVARYTNGKLETKKVKVKVENKNEVITIDTKK